MDSFAPTPARTSAVEAGSVQGSLSPERLAAALRELERSRADGTLYVFAERAVNSVHFRGGRIAFASSDSMEEELEESLRRARRLPGTGLEEVMDAVRARTLLSSSDVARMETSLSIVHSLFSFTSGEYLFEPRRLPPGYPAPIDLSPTEAILEGMKRSAPASAAEHVLGDLSGVVWWNENDGSSALSFPESTLSTEETKLVDLLKEHARDGLPTKVVLERSALPREETLAGLCALVCAGIVSIEEGRPGEASPPGAGPGRLAAPAKLGRFEVVRLLGRGSMGSVFLAHDPAMDRVVAIKLIQLPLDLTPAQHEKYSRRFYREASAAGQLSHDGIVTVYDVGHTDEGAPFIVMEYVEGRTLRDLLEERRLPQTEALQIAHDVLGGLGYAHARGIVHRDVKPSNILVTPDCRAKIMDFGIAHVVGSELTSGDDVLGSPYYMAPEQFQQDVVDQRTDLFSFAVVLYRMLTGELPFTGETFAAIAHAVLAREPTPLPKRDPALRPELDAIVSRCLAKSPEDRYESAGDVANDLTDFEFQTGNDAISSQGLWGPDGFSRARRKGPPPDRWVPIAVALVMGALLVFGLTLAIDEQVKSADSLMSSLAAPPRPPRPPPYTPRTQTRRPPEVVSAERFAAELAADVDPASADDDGRSSGSSAAPPVPAPLVPASPPPPEPSRSTEADLFYEARVALEQGRISRSRTLLGELLRRNPDFEGGFELMEQIRFRLWLRELPLRFRARHAHRIGGCEGELTLDGGELQYRSNVHAFTWGIEDVRLMERFDAYSLQIETYDETFFGLGKHKRFNFELDPPLKDEDWAHYRRLVK